MTDELLVGMLPGTRRDSVNAVLANVRHDSMELLHATSTPYPVAIRRTLDQLLESGRRPEPALTNLLDENLGRFFARLVQNLVREAGMEMRDIRAIGSHGQTIWQQPGLVPAVSTPLGNGALIAKNTGATVVCNFRQADIEAGGQGAPLAPLLYRKMFYSDRENRVIVNIGDIAELTQLSANGDISSFDCGPGNCLMDAWTKRCLNKAYDKRGDWARKGSVEPGLLDRLLEASRLKLQTPKSKSHGSFDLNWLDITLDGFTYQPGDVQATLAELTATSIANSLDKGVVPDRLLVCGGGAHNTFLLRRLASLLPDTVVETTSRFGADPDWAGSLLFAWLAQQRLEEKFQDTRLLTGSKRPVLLGDIHHPPEKTRR